MTETNTYLIRAVEARAEADLATLENVKERFLRSEAAWRAMAERVAYTEELRAKRLADSEA